MRDPLPEDVIDEVVDLPSFLRFLTALQKDFEKGHRYTIDDRSVYGINSNGTGWYNGTIDQYFEAAVAAYTDNPMTDADLKDENPWSVCAGVLMAGKYYE